MSEQGGGQSTAYAALGYILSGLLFYGGLGWLASAYFQQPVLIGIGLIVGAGLGVYMIVKRFGALDAAPKATSSEETAWRP